MISVCNFQKFMVNWKKHPQGGCYKTPNIPPPHTHTKKCHTKQIYGHKIFQPSKDFWIQNILRLKYVFRLISFSGPNSLELKIFLDPKLFTNLIFFLNNILLGSKILLGPKYCWPKICVDIFFSDQIFQMQHFFPEQKFFGTQHYFRHKKSFWN